MLLEKVNVTDTTLSLASSPGQSYAELSQPLDITGTGTLSVLPGKCTSATFSITLDRKCQLTDAVTSDAKGSVSSDVSALAVTIYNDFKYVVSRASWNPNNSAVTCGRRLRR